MLAAIERKQEVPVHSLRQHMHANDGETEHPLCCVTCTLPYGMGALALGLKSAWCLKDSVVWKIRGRLSLLNVFEFVTANLYGGFELITCIIFSSKALESLQPGKQVKVNRTIS